MHDVTNGLLLQRDLHSLFHRGYIIVSPELRFEVRRRIKEEFENGGTTTHCTVGPFRRRRMYWGSRTGRR